MSNNVVCLVLGEGLYTFKYISINHASKIRLYQFTINVKQEEARSQFVLWCVMGYNT